MKYLKKFRIFESHESQDDEDYEVYKITAEDEIGNEYCNDFMVADLKVGDKIYKKLIDADDWTHEWAKDPKKPVPIGVAIYDFSGPTEYEVVEVGENEIKLK